MTDQAEAEVVDRDQLAVLSFHDDDSSTPRLERLVIYLIVRQDELEVNSP